MKTVKIILYILQDLFVVFMFIFSVWGCFLMWTDAEYANYLAAALSRAFGDAQSSDGATIIHKVFITILLLAFTTFLAFVFMEDNSVKKLKRSKKPDK